MILYLTYYFKDRPHLASHPVVWSSHPPSLHSMSVLAQCAQLGSGVKKCPSCLARPSSLPASSLLCPPARDTSTDRITSPRGKRGQKRSGVDSK